MASGDSHIPALRCAEDIALLHFLHPVTTPPLENSVSDALIHRKGYTLPFDRERRLASTLAFLANTSDDPNHIPAICIAEDAASGSLNVLLAVNKAHPEDGNQNLQQLKNGFENIFKVLSRLQKSSAEVQNTVFDAIVGMCRSRILCRLGFTATSRNKGKQTIKIMLQDTIKSLSMLKAKKPAKHVPFSKIFTQRAKEVIRRTDLWAKHQTIARLRDLVSSIHHLGQAGDAHPILAAIPSTSMDPNSVKRLLNVIRKVGRYEEAARFLYRTAKKFRAARQMRAVPITLPPKLFQRQKMSKNEPTLLHTLSRFRGRHVQRDLNHICSILKTKEAVAKDNFAQRVRRTVAEAKIHAEIQLLYHYEIQSSTLPPRVVCSSKDACYMCNAFIIMHGKMHTPRCHGRIYPGWRLPFLPNCKGMEERLNMMLDALIRSSLERILVKRTRIAYPDPNESTLLTLPHSASTVLSVAMTAAEKTPVLQTLGAEQAGPASFKSHQELPPVSVLAHSDSPLVAGFVTEFPNKSLQSTERPLSESSPDSASASSLGTIEQYVELSSGNLVLGSTKVGALPRFFSAGHLELVIEHATEPEGDSERVSSKLHYGVEWLEDNAVTALQRLEAPVVIDAETLSGEVTYHIVGSFLVMGHGLVVKVSLL